MTEWGVVGVIVTLLTLIFTVGKPIISLNSSITQLTAEVASILKGLEDFKQRYKDHLKELKDADQELTDWLDDHEHRITVLEERDLPKKPKP